MMPVVRITDATWDRLKRWAVPLEDTAEDAVRKVLDAAEEHLRCGQPRTSMPNHKVPEKPSKKIIRLQRGLKTPNRTYRRPILEALYELGGSASGNKVLKIVEEKVKLILNEVDLEKLPSCLDVRWHNAAYWVRWQLVKEGLLKPDSPRGIWELSERGIEELKKAVY